MRRSHLSPLVLLLLPAVSAPLASQTFVLRRGNDTISVEQARVRGDTLSADGIIGSVRIRTSLTLITDRARRPTSLRSKMWLTTDSLGAPPRQSAEVTFPGDSVIVSLDGGGQKTVQRIGSKRGAIPYVNPSIALVELVIARASAEGNWPASIPLFMMAGGQTVDATLSRVGRDTVVVSIAGADMRLSVDARNRVLGGTIPSQGIAIDRRDGPTAAFTPDKLDYSAPGGAPYRAIEVVVDRKSVV